MCNLFLTLQPPCSKHALILLSIRDEMLLRPTAEAAWRDGILSGIDLQDPLKGTWFGVNEQGKIGVLLSITHRQRKDATSRGRIVHDFLSSSMTGKEFCDSLVAHAGEYNGFTFVAIDRPTGDYEMHSFTNELVDELAPLKWSRDTHVVGNCPPHATYAKLKHGKALFGGILPSISETTTNDEIASSLFTIGVDKKECYPDAQLDKQVKGFDARGLSSIFVRIGSPPLYGTRCQTALIVEKDGSAFLRERRFLSITENGKEQWEEKDFSFAVPAKTN